MNTKELNELLSWMKSTDIVEMSFHRGGEGFEFRSEGAPRPGSPFAPSTLVPVASPAIGVFQWNVPGAPRKADEGQTVAAGDTLGVVEMGSKSIPVAAPAAGRILKVVAQEGQAVEYGQTLFLIAP